MAFLTTYLTVVFRRLIVATLALAVLVFGHPQTILVPFLLAVIWWGAHRPLRRLWRRLAPRLASTLGYCVWALWSIRRLPRAR